MWRSCERRFLFFPIYRFFSFLSVLLHQENATTAVEDDKVVEFLLCLFPEKTCFYFSWMMYSDFQEYDVTAVGSRVPTTSLNTFKHLVAVVADFSFITFYY